jgi:predicted anti-sigma-YlaC factor YlaD
MTCDALDKLIPLYVYGELTPDEEEQVEEHLHRCQDCARGLDRQRGLMAVLDRREAELPASLLADCRGDLQAAVRREAATRARPNATWRLSMSEALARFFASVSRFRQPIGALALVAVGFFAARFTGSTPTAPVSAPALSDQVFATVRSVQADGAGGVHIAFDETRRRSVAGRVDDERIRRLLLAAARDDNNAAVRVESVGLLKATPESGEIRSALLNALANDPNAGVRLKALEGLKPQAADTHVRKGLAQALLTDDNPAVRMQIIDLLVEHRDNSMVGILQNVVQKEDNNYVRLKCEKALKDMNASIGTF